MNIINRIGQYLAPGRSWYQRAVNTIKVITVHHTAGRETGTNDQILQTLANGHTAQGWPGLAYHFAVLKDGTIYQINNFSDVTWHDAINWDSIGVVLQGYFHPPYNEVPTDAQLKSLHWLLNELTTQHPEFPADATTIYGHRERSSTACCGDNLIWYAQNYRLSNGDVGWGPLDPTPTPIPPVDLNWSYDQKMQVVTLVQKGTGSVFKYKLRGILNIPYIP